MITTKPMVREFELPLKKSDVAQILGVSVMTVDREMWAGRLKYAKIGKGSVRFYAHHIQDYLLSCEISNNSSENQTTANAS